MELKAWLLLFFSIQQESIYMLPVWSHIWTQRGAYICAWLNPPLHCFCQCFLSVLCKAWGFVEQCARVCNSRRREEKLAAESQSVNYLLIQFGRWLPKKVEGSLELCSKEEGRDNLLLQSPTDFHLHCLQEKSVLWAMPGCIAYHLFIKPLPSFTLSCLYYIAFCQCIPHISSMSSHLSLLSPFLPLSRVSNTQWLLSVFHMS